MGKILLGCERTIALALPVTCVNWSKTTWRQARWMAQYEFGSGAIAVRH